MSKWDNTNFEKVASREPDGFWACCLCTGWKNREADHEDYFFEDDEEIEGHLTIYHHISIDILSQPFNTMFPRRQFIKE